MIINFGVFFKNGTREAREKQKTAREKCQKHDAKRSASGTSQVFFQIPKCIKSP